MLSDFYNTIELLAEAVRVDTAIIKILAENSDLRAMLEKGEGDVPIKS